MTRVLVVWEDANYESLGEVARRAVRATALTTDAEAVRVVSHTAYSNGGFDRYASRTWPLVRPRGLPLDPGPIDHIICVVDADRLHDLRGIAKAPADPAAVSAWHAAAERSWQAWLRSRCDASGPPAETVHGVVLRWSKESLVLAGYDQPAMTTHLAIAAAPEQLRELCPIQPSTVDDRSFTDTYQRPQGCLKQLRQAHQLAPLRKSDPTIESALRELARKSMPILRARVPDLARLATLICNLHGETR